MRVTLRLLSTLAQRRPFYVTTPIFYVNAAPHLGHLYTAVVADAIQRFEKLTNPNCTVIFSTGTDEHGTKIQQAAAKANLSPAEYCDKMSNEYRELFKQFNVQYTDFIRTTEERHKKAVTHFWNKLLENDYIYKGKYSGWYSVNDEAFVPEAHLKDELVDGQMVKVSVESGHRVEWTEETNYMFRLSAFNTHLINWLKNDGVITPSKFQRQVVEVLEREYTADISVSRPTARVPWAITVPEDEQQTIYVWLDALVSYLTACGYPDEERMRARRRPWPADVHVLGKDILKFHGIYWAAFLMAIRWPPPRRLVCHSHWTVEGVKMSKSLGNVVSPAAAAAPLHPEGLRYMLLREGTLHADANYSEHKLINICNSELADTLGNLVSRCCGPALNPRAEHPPLRPQPLRSLADHPCTDTLLRECSQLPERCHRHYSQYQFYRVVDAVVRVLHLANLFFETHKPWELKKHPDKQADLDTVLHITIETLRVCAIILQPIVPLLSHNILNKLQINEHCRSWQHLTPSWDDANAISELKHIQSGKFVLFERVYKQKNVNVAGQEKKEKTHKKKASV